MKKEERDIFDELFHSKLYDFETDTHDDWESIASRLPDPKVIPLRRRWPYWAAAAVASLLVISSGIYFSLKQPLTDDQTAQQIEKETNLFPVTPLNEEQVVIATAKRPVTGSAGTTGMHHKIQEQRENRILTKKEIQIQDQTKPEITIPDLPEKITIFEQQPLLPEVTGVTSKEKGKKSSSSRKWTFGAGAGGFTESSGNIINTYALRSHSQIDDTKLLSLNAVADKGKEPKTNIKHKTPVSFGVSASRQLNDRFSLQTGLTYSMLTSDWETQAEIYNNKTRQRLHFIGIPLSVSYKIMEWNRFRLYASVGGQTEVNIAGKERVKSYFENQQTGVDSRNVRMKEWQWSVNARVGISYPIVRFVSAFAEVGAVYYFDNGSHMETIYSDKEFNVNPQFGIRFGF